jgi:hypothetical protein
MTTVYSEIDALVVLTLPVAVTALSILFSIAPYAANGVLRYQSLHNMWRNGCHETYLPFLPL